MDRREKEAKEIEEALGRGDYFEFWLEEADRHVRQTGYFSGSLAEIMNVFQSAFGKEWILSEVAAYKPPKFPDDGASELVSWIVTPGVRQVLSVIETCVYLRWLMDAQNLADIIGMLKTRQFETAFMQLAHGYRFQRLGGKDLRFEPEAAMGRKADISFTFEGQPYIVECYVPGSGGGGMPWYSEVLNYSGNKILEWADELKKRVIVHIDFGDRQSLTGQERKALEGHCRRLIADCEPAQHVEEMTDVYTVRIVDTSAMSDQTHEELRAGLDDNSTCGMQASRVPKDQLREIMRGHETDSAPSSALLLNTNDRLPGLGEIVDELADKLEKKVVQLRQDHDGVKGLLLAGSYYGRPRDQGRVRHFEKVKRKVLDSHKNVSGILIVDRVTEETGRSLYVGTFIDDETDRTTRKLLWELSVLENQRDVLSDWP